MNSSEENITSITVEPRSDVIQGMNKQHIAGSSDTISGGNLDKIRDILFGTQIREFEQRFSRLEERLLKENTNVRDDAKRRLDSLETYVRQEINSLTESVKKQQSARDEVIKELTEAHKNQINAIEQKLEQVEEETSRSARELRQQILDQSNSLSDEIRDKFAEMLSVLERENQELRNDKANRSTLSALFAELAMRLRSE